MKIPKDKMTSKERMIAYMKGESVDRLPVSLTLTETTSYLFGASIEQYYNEPSVVRDIEVKKYRLLGGDGLTLGSGRYDVVEALGGEVLYGGNTQKHILDPVIKDYKMLDGLEVVSPYKAASHIRTRKTIELALEALGEELLISAKISGPISIAAELRGVESLLRDLLVRPDEVHKLLKFIAECNNEFIKSIANDFGIAVGVSDPVSSNSLISPRQFREFSFPYLKDNCDHIVKYCGRAPSLHICGKTKPIWEDLIKLEISSFSVDNEEDMLEMKKIMGDHVTIVGNVDPVDIMRFGREEDVAETTLDCIRKSLNSPKGFILVSCKSKLHFARVNSSD